MKTLWKPYGAIPASINVTTSPTLEERTNLNVASPISLFVTDISHGAEASTNLSVASLISLLVTHAAKTRKRKQKHAEAPAKARRSTSRSTSTNTQQHLSATRAQEPPEPKSHQSHINVPSVVSNTVLPFLYSAVKIFDMQYLRYDFRNPIQLHFMNQPTSYAIVRDPGKNHVLHPSESI